VAFLWQIVDAPVIYTIGHSTHGLDVFLALLEEHRVNCVIDIRSTPYSRIAPQFAKPALAATLKNHGVRYAHFAQEFGARHTDPALLDEKGVVDFQKVRATENFHQGVRRLRDGLAQGFVIALLCAESNPFDCHRFSMVSYQLARDGLTVKHILKDGSLQDNAELESELLEKYRSKILNFLCLNLKRNRSNRLTACAIRR
jgi:uncharacterized protein (DUF488 family)